MGETFLRDHGLEWRGKYTDVVNDEWWCPTEQKWSSCPGPCPDGTPHGPKRTTKTTAKLLERVDGAEGDE